MIDTICLQIPMGNVIYLDRDNKTISDWDLQARTEQYQKFIKNPSKQDKESGLYFPRLTTYTRRGSEPTLKVEFSAPKLLFLNNVQELSDSDFEHVVNALQDRLKRMGSVFKKDIIEAQVSAVHYS